MSLRDRTAPDALELDSLVQDTRAADEALREHVSSRVDFSIYLCLLVVISLAVLTNLTTEQWWEAAFQCSVFALAALWIVSGGFSRSRYQEANRLAIPLILLLVLALVQLLPLLQGAEILGSRAARTISYDPYGTRLFIYKLLALVLFGGLLLQLVTTRFRLRALIFVLIGIGVISALVGIIEQRMLRDASGFFLTFMEANRGFGQFTGRNHFAVLMEMALGLALGLVFGGGFRSRWLFVGFATVLPLWSALVLANSRAGLITMLCQVVFIVLIGSTIKIRSRLHVRRRSRRWASLSRSLVRNGLLAACVLIASLIGALWIGGQPLVQRLSNEPITNELKLQASADGKLHRWGMWKATWELIQAHPVIGVGFGGYWMAIPTYYQSSGNKELHQAHNDYLEVLASGGVIGGLLMLWFLAVLIYTAWKRLYSSDPFRRAACLGALTGIVGVAIHSAFDFGLHLTINAIVLVAVIVIATVDVTAEHEAVGNDNQTWVD